MNKSKCFPIQIVVKKSYQLHDSITFTIIPQIY